MLLGPGSGEDRVSGPGCGVSGRVIQPGPGQGRVENMVVGQESQWQFPPVGAGVCVCARRDSRAHSTVLKPIK